MLTGGPLPEVAAYPVGLESRLKEVWSLLNLRSSDRDFPIIGFFGVQGIGKSVLARAVHNSIAHLFFEGSYFLDLKEINTHNLVDAQKKLLSKISGATDIQLENVDEGVSLIKNLLFQKDVLLILDNVGSLEQIEALGRGSGWELSSGSRVIVTTQNKDLLTYLGDDMLLYEVQALNAEDALELLSHKAFDDGNVDPMYTEVLNRAIKYAFGNPFVLDKIGSFLKGKSVDECKNALDRLEKIRRDGREHAFTKEEIQSIKRALMTSRSDPEEAPLIHTESSQTESNAGVTSQIVFFVSCGVGLSCNALSSFKDEEKNRWWWPVFKKFPYVVVALAVLAPILRLNRYEIISRLNRYEIIRRLKCCIRYVIFVGIAVYSELYNRAVEPGKASVFSNVAFALTSLSLSKLLVAESEKGAFGYFLGCFIIQLSTIKRYLIFVGITVGVLLFDWHSFSEPFLLTLLTQIVRSFRAIPPRNLNDLPVWFAVERSQASVAN